MNGTDIKPWDYGPLSVTPNHRYFRNGEKPFFLLADTARLFFHSLTPEESYRYLRNRKELGFNCILADFLHSPEQKIDRPYRLITYHPFGRTCSSNWFQNEEWLDFHLFQSGPFPLTG